LAGGLDGGVLLDELVVFMMIGFVLLTVDV
jgi:hypothetical protein